MRRLAGKETEYDAVTEADELAGDEILLQRAGDQKREQRDDKGHYGRDRACVPLISHGGGVLKRGDGQSGWE